MHIRAHFVALLLVGCGAAEPAAPAAPAPAAPPAATLTAAPAATTPPAVVSAPAPVVNDAPAPTSPAGCKKVAWDMPTTLGGKATKASGKNASMTTEKYVALELTTPICGPDGAPVSRIQLIPMGSNTYASLAKLEHKTVTVTGSPSAAMTAHHHEPVVFDVNKVE